MMVAEYYGIDCTMEELVERIPLPAIVLWTNNHYVVVDEADDSRIHVLDPARGSVWYSHEEFQRGWHQEDKQTGVLMAVEWEPPLDPLLSHVSSFLQSAFLGTRRA